MGAKVSKNTNVVNDSIEQSIQDTMSATVNAKAEASCSNIQEVKNLTNCRINFGNQTCEAIAINDVAVSGAFDRSVVQETASKLQQEAATKSEGIYVGLAQVSDSSNFVKKTTKVSMDTKMSFETECSKQARGMNVQSVVDATCSGTENGYDINFGNQTMTLKAVGSCVANTAGSSSAAQSLKQMIGQSAKDDTKGVDPASLITAAIMGIVLPLVMPIIMLVGGVVVLPIALRSFTKVVKEIPADPEKQSEEQKAHIGNSMRTKSIMTLMFVVFLTYIILAGVMGYWPLQLRKNYLPLDVCTPEGDTYDKQQVINKFMWYDPMCISSGSSACTEEDKIVAYDSCGIMAKQGGCDDPEFLQAKSDYITASKLCSEVSVLETMGIQTCNGGQIADKVFNSNGYGSMCKRCYSTDPTLALMNGLYVRLDPDKWDIENKKGDNKCNPAELEQGKFLPDDCYMKCDTVHSGAYFVPEGEHCPADLKPGVVCHEGKAAFDDAVSGSAECDNVAYQEAKRSYAALLHGCNNVKKEYMKKFPEADAAKLPLSQMCEPDEFQYFTKCSRSTFKCNYKGSTAEADLFCKNDFSECEDPGYLADLKIEQKASVNCKAAMEKQKKAQKTADTVPYLFLAAIIVLILLLIWSFRSQQRSADILAKSQAATRKLQAQYAKLGALNKLKQSMKSTKTIPVIAVCLIAVGVAFLTVESIKNEKVGQGLAGGGGALLAVYVFFTMIYKKDEKETIDWGGVSFG